MNIKNHLRENKKLYVGIAIGASIAGFTYLIMRGQTSGGWYSSQKEDGGGILPESNVIDLSNFSGNNNSILNTTNIYDHKPPLSYIVSQDGTDKWWVSQADTARDLGLYESDVSKHLNHGKDLPCGISLTRRGVAS